MQDPRILRAGSQDPAMQDPRITSPLPQQETGEIPASQWDPEAPQTAAGASQIAGIATGKMAGNAAWLRSLDTDSGQGWIRPDQV